MKKKVKNELPISENLIRPFHYITQINNRKYLRKSANCPTNIIYLFLREKYCAASTVIFLQFIFYF